MTQRIFAIGDIHGESQLLGQILSSIVPTLTPDDLVVFVGDYIDRGEDSLGVIDQILDLVDRFPGQIVTLKGNHEQLMQQWFVDPNAFWLEAMEGWATIDSYLAGESARFRHQLRDGIDDYQLLVETRSRFMEEIPDEHRDFFAKLSLSYVTDNFIFAHGGIDPTKPVSDQSENDLLWTDGRTLLSRWQGPQTLVVGHKPTHKLNERYRGQPVLGDHMILLDTGSNRTGVLSAVVLPDRHVIQSRRSPDPAT